MTENLWTLIDPAKWKETPCIAKRCAKEEDVQAGRAVFFMGNIDEVPAWPMNIEIPRLALWFDEETESKKIVVIIQAEESEIQQTIGIRFFDGGNGVCLFEELELVDESHEQFKNLIKG